MTTKKTPIQIQLEALHSGLERGAPAGDLAPLVESLHARLAVQPTETDASALEAKLARHISSVHEEALLGIWLETALVLMYRLKTMRTHLYSAAEGVRDPASRQDLARSIEELAQSESVQLKSHLDSASAEDLVKLARTGLQRWGSPSFLAYEAIGLHGQGHAEEARARANPLTQLEDRTGLRSSGLSEAAAASETLGDQHAAARWALLCHEDDVAAPVLLPAAFLYALRARDQQLCLEADARLEARFGQAGEDSTFVVTLLRRAQAQELEPESSPRHKKPVFARADSALRSPIAKRIHHALAQTNHE